MGSPEVLFFCKMRTAAIIATVGVTLGVGLGFWLPLPKIPGLGMTDRNLFFHVPMWFTMYVLMGISLWWSGHYLVKGDLESDRRAREAAVVAVFFGLLGLLTGILWSRVTWAEALPDSDWQAWWGWDPKQTFALIALLVYGAYFFLRQGVREVRLRAQLSAAYNVMAAILVWPLTFLLPRYLGGLHPGSEGTPAFRGEDISPLHRVVFYISAIGFIALGVWVWMLRVRLSRLEARATTARDLPAEVA